MVRIVISVSLLLMFSVSLYADDHEPCNVPRQWRKMNSALPVCFGAEDGSHKDFESRLNMAVYAFKYVRRGGHHLCSYDTGGYFGCDNLLYHSERASHHPQVHGDTYYGRTEHEYQFDEKNGIQQDPKKGFQQDTQKRVQEDSKQKGVQRDFQLPPFMNPLEMIHERNPGPLYMQEGTVFLTDTSDLVIYPQEPFQPPYYHIPSVNRPAWDSSIVLPVNNGPIEIHAAETYRLYHGEDLYDIGHEDNSGELCIDIYGYGHELLPLGAAEDNLPFVNIAPIG